MFLVVEIQKNGDSLAHLETVCATSAEAETKYHQILAAAASSQVEKHGAIIIGEDSYAVRSESYGRGAWEAEE